MVKASAARITGHRAEQDKIVARVLRMPAEPEGRLSAGDPLFGTAQHCDASASGQRESQGVSEKSLRKPSWTGSYVTYTAQCILNTNKFMANFDSKL